MTGHLKLVKIDGPLELGVMYNHAAVVPLEMTARAVGAA